MGGLMSVFTCMTLCIHALEMCIVYQYLARVFLTLRNSIPDVQFYIPRIMIRMFCVINDWIILYCNTENFFFGVYQYFFAILYHTTCKFHKRKTRKIQWLNNMITQKTRIRNIPSGYQFINYSHRHTPSKSLKNICSLEDFKNTGCTANSLWRTEKGRMLWTAVM